VHFVEHELVTVVVLLAQLGLQLVKVDTLIVRLQILLLLLQNVGSLLFGVFNAPIAWFTLVVATLSNGLLPLRW